MTHITRRELLERLIEYKGEEASLPITYAELFTVGELYEMVIENEAKKELAETIKTCNSDPAHIINVYKEVNWGKPSDEYQKSQPYHNNLYSYV